MSEATTADEQLRLFIERIERLEEEKKGIADDIRDVYLESKSQGYDPKIMRQIVRLRKMPVHDRKEMEAILDVYKSALGIGNLLWAGIGDTIRVSLSAEPEEEVRVEPGVAVSRGCRCNIDHYARVLAQFPETERQEMADDDGIIQVDCAFCSRLFPVPLDEIATRH